MGPAVATTTLAPSMRPVLWNMALSCFVAGSVGSCFFLTYRPDEEGLLVLVELQGS